ncbi:hypothetical protein R1sor_021737 [Riccia sorocarpa]|uniref:MULE transposase domain-containing protein n=1 Tax=Riccia sorocarpa TaxID=122646 RepID=A0ABD3GJK1_9MARC
MPIQVGSLIGIHLRTLTLSGELSFVLQPRGILRYCEKVVALDACFTKNKKYPTQLFLASVVDGNSQIVPQAYAVAPVENYENWSWFVHNLQISIQGLRSEAVMIVSDRQKGLERAVTELLPCNPHIHCGHHLKMNVAVHVFQNLLHAKSEDRISHEHFLPCSSSCDTNETAQGCEDPQWRINSGGFHSRV